MREFAERYRFDWMGARVDIAMAAAHHPSNYFHPLPTLARRRVPIVAFGEVGCRGARDELRATSHQPSLTRAKERVGDGWHARDDCPLQHLARDQ
jgi:hypothetical protein